MDPRVIDPLPQLPVRPGLAEAAGGRDLHDAPGDAFAQILAAATAQPSAPGDAPLTMAAPGAPAPVALTDTAAAATPPPAPDAPQPTAHVFNQEGFFGAATAAEAEAAMPASLQTAVPAGRLPAAAEDAAGIAPAGRLPAREARILPTRAGTRVAPALDAARPASVRVGGAGGAASRPFARTDAAPQTERGGTPARSAARRPLVERQASGGARSPIEVALRELEHGIHVAARVDRLDDAERVRLRDEIAALLARHGLSARHIQIFAPPARGQIIAPPAQTSGQRRDT